MGTSRTIIPLINNINLRKFNGIVGCDIIRHYSSVIISSRRHSCTHSSFFLRKFTRNSIIESLTITSSTSTLTKPSKLLVTRLSLSTTTDGGNDDDSIMKRREYNLLQHITHSTRSLGVWEGIESRYTTDTSKRHVWESIRQLPEIDTVVNCLQKIQQLLDPSSSSSSISTVSTSIIALNQLAITALERAIQIFGSYRPGGMEQMAAFALLVEFQNRNNQYDTCHTTLLEILSVYKNNNESEDISLNDIVQIARAKVYWYQGEHGTGKEICDQLVDEERPVCVAARTGQAVTRLVLVSTLFDAFSVRDPFRMAIRRLERMVNPSATALAAAYLNMGIVEMSWAETVSKFNDVDAPLDAAMRNWKQGVTVLTKGELISHHGTFSSTNMKKRILNKDSELRSILHARLLSNMAFGMLHMNHHADYISRSLEYASESLAIYDGLHKSKKTGENDDLPILIDKEGLGRTLSLLATVYHLQGNAVMAQGLFQSSLDKVPINYVTSSTDATPLQLVEQCDTYERYADLCNDWEQREGDVKQLRQKGEDINSLMLPDGWKDKTSIHGSLWFWTEATIHRH